MLVDDYKLIYCADGNDYFIKIALKEGFKYGRQLPTGSIYSYPMYFTDQNWKNPKKEEYIASIKKYKPFMSTVIDIDAEDKYDEALDWADRISDSVEVIILIPKIESVMDKLPKQVNGKKVILGYSVPSAYGKTDLPTELFEGWEVHLLGGTPHSQLTYADKFKIYSIDCNGHFVTAIKSEKYWLGNYGESGPYWSHLNYGTEYTYFERSMKAFELSSRAIRIAWENIYKQQKSSSLR